MEPMTVTLSHELKRLRTERQLSQERLAERVDISQAALSRYESGKNSDASIPAPDARPGTG